MQASPNIDGNASAPQGLENFVISNEKQRNITHEKQNNPCNIHIFACYLIYNNM